jgi:hypothetical protein
MRMIAWLCTACLVVACGTVIAQKPDNSQVRFGTATSLEAEHLVALKQKRPVQNPRGYLRMSRLCGHLSCG